MEVKKKMSDELILIGAVILSAILIGILVYLTVWKTYKENKEL